MLGLRFLDPCTALCFVLVVFLADDIFRILDSNSNLRICGDRYSFSNHHQSVRWHPKSHPIAFQETFCRQAVRHSECIGSHGFPAMAAGLTLTTEVPLHNQSLFFARSQRFHLFPFRPCFYLLHKKIPLFSSDSKTSISSCPQRKFDGGNVENIWKYFLRLH